MKEFPRNLLICFLLAVPLYLAGSNLYRYTLENWINIKMAVHRVNSRFLATFGCGLAMALIPFAVVLCWKFVPINRAGKRIWSAVIITSSAIFAFVYRIYLIKRIPIPGGFHGNEKYEVMIPFESLNLENFLFIGLAAGAVIVILFMGDKRSQQISPVSSTN